jgi:nucleotide-binding universal stress UspA family protein
VKRIVYATDFSGQAAAAERQAIELAKALGAELVLAYVGTDAALWREGVYTPEVRAVVEGQRKWAAEALAARAAARLLARCSPSGPASTTRSNQL